VHALHTDVTDGLKPQECQNRPSRLLEVADGGGAVDYIVVNPLKPLFSLTLRCALRGER